MGFFNKAILNAGKAVAPPSGALTGAIKPAAPSGGSGPLAKAVQTAQAVAAKATPTPTPIAQKPTQMMPQPTAIKKMMQGFRGMRFKEGGKTSSNKSSGKVSSASKRGDGIAQRGKTKGRML